MVSCPVLGYFTTANNIKNVKDFGGRMHQGADDERVCFMPNYDTLQTQGYKFKENNPTCLPCLTPQEIKLRNVFATQDIERINYDAIAQASQVAEPVVVYVLK